jgi:hypothetical protein
VIRGLEFHTQQSAAVLPAPRLIRLAYAEGLMTVIGAGWVTRADLADTPGEMLGRADYFIALPRSASSASTEPSAI